MKNRHSQATAERCSAKGATRNSSEAMKTLLMASTQKPRKSRVVALLRPARKGAGTRGAARSVTSGLREQKARPLPDAAPHTESTHVRFDRFFPDAREVSIAGSFNGWQPAAAPMQRFGTGCGQWKVDLHLKPGRYEYRFVVDGTWTDDPFARTFVPNPFGTRNAVFVLGAGDNAEDCATNSQAAEVGSAGQFRTPPVNHTTTKRKVLT